jgi:hypothetical protein
VKTMFNKIKKVKNILFPKKKLKKKSLCPLGLKENWIIFDKIIFFKKKKKYIFYKDKKNLFYL